MAGEELAQPAEQVQPVSGITAPVQALLPLAPTCPKPTTADREKMRRDLEKAYPGIVVSGATLPAMGFLQTVHAQCNSKCWEWIGWKRILSEDASVEVRARKGSQCLDLAAALTTAAGLQMDEWDQELGASALRVQRLVETRAFAYTMVGAGHLAAWTTYIQKFVHFYAK